jgi:hypothetical protein
VVCCGLRFAPLDLSVYAMTFSLKLLLLGAVLLTITMVCSIAFRRAIHGKFRFSTRGLLAFVALTAVIVASTVGYRRAVMAQLTWIPVPSQQATGIFPIESVVPDSDGKYRFVYYARRTSVQRLLGQLTQMSYTVDRQSVQVTARDESSAREQLKKLQDSDTLATGVFVIRGRVVDKNGDPLAGATIDLMGSYVFINHFQTREDGTFTMPLTDGRSNAPAGSGYYLRIRPKEETADNHVRWNTRSFSLNSSRPEMASQIVVPR